jgi:iron complex outermembrane receptor protein
MKEMNVYAQYSGATDALSNSCCITAAQMAIDAARGTQVEAGVKQVLAGGRAEWTVAGYRIVKHDLLVPDPVLIATLIQVGQQSSTGVEATVSFDLGYGLRVGANGTVLRPRFDDFFEVISGQRISRVGNRPTNVPWQSGNILAFWSFRQNWLAQGTVRFVGDRYIDNANTVVLPSYTVVDAGIRRSLSNRVAVDFRLMNLGNTFYAYNFSSNGLGGGNWNVGQPRSFEISLTAGF